MTTNVEQHGRAAREQIRLHHDGTRRPAGAVPAHCAIRTGMAPLMDISATQERSDLRKGE